jgi:hypothetical protein
VAVIFAASESPAAACCVPMTEAQRIDISDVIFEGTALDGPTESGIQQIRVSRYLKGDGPDIVAVRTGTGLTVMSTVGIRVSAGSEWRIFGQRQPDGTVNTNICLGSGQLPLPALGENVRQAAPGPNLVLGDPVSLTEPPKTRQPRVAKQTKSRTKRTARRPRGSLKRR